jgi:hypothetical protein
MKTISPMLMLNQVVKQCLAARMNDSVGRAHYSIDGRWTVDGGAKRETRGKLTTCKLGLPGEEVTTIMAFMNRTLSKKGGPAPSRAIEGLPRVSYYPPVVVTLAATLFVFLIMLILTIIALGDTVAQWNSTSTGEGGGTSGALLCGVVAIVGMIGSVYFFLALIKGGRDLFSPIQYTRGSLADKRVIGGRFVGNWIGVSPSYIGPSLQAASEVTEEQAAASADRAQILQTRSAPAPVARDRKRGSYLAPERISSTLVTDPSVPNEKDPRRVFRVETDCYEGMMPGEEVLVAHTRFLEHIYYVAHLRDGAWESFKSKALI